LVSLLATFIYFYDKHNLNFNIIYSATSEEEISGINGIELILDDVGKIDFAIIGEPTDMEMAIAEKGLVVLDCFAIGKAGHAARNTGDNAILKAIKDINWFQSYQFPKVSETLGPVQMNVTMIEAGLQHNIIPDICRFTVDIRTTDAYTNQEIVEIVRKNVSCDVNPRSTRLKPSKIEKDHPLVKAALNRGIPLYGSPTTSDQAVIPFPSVKIGPGKSERSHTADEFIFLTEIEEGIDKYITILNELNVLIK
jgi:acetylornithine deacetylase